MCGGHPDEAQAPAFVAIGRGAVLGIHWCRGRLGSLPSSPPAPSPAGCSPVVASFTRPVPAPLPQAQPGWRRPWCLLQACVWPFEATPDQFSSRGKDTRPLPLRPGGGGLSRSQRATVASHAHALGAGLQAVIAQAA